MPTTKKTRKTKRGQKRGVQALYTKGQMYSQDPLYISRQVYKSLENSKNSIDSWKGLLEPKTLNKHSFRPVMCSLINCKVLFLSLNHTSCSKVSTFPSHPRPFLLLYLFQEENKSPIIQSIAHSTLKIAKINSIISIRAIGQCKQDDYYSRLSSFPQIVFD